MKHSKKSVVHIVNLCGRQESTLQGKHNFGNVTSQDIEIIDSSFCAVLRFHAQSGDLVLENTLKVVLAMHSLQFLPFKIRLLRSAVTS